MEIRKFTDKGIDQFREYLSALRDGSTDAPPYHLLTDPGTSLSLSGEWTIECKNFDSKLKAAEYLDDVLAGVDIDGIENDIHLWSWMSLFYFEQVCPEDKHGMRKPGRDYRHIPEPGYPYGHRHLLGGAFMVYTIYGLGDRLSKLLLYTSPSMESKYHHELATRQSFITNRGIMEAVHQLYFNEKAERPKRGALGNSGKPGTFFRFINVVQQLDLTYDLYSMAGEEVSALLPPEFDEWKRDDRF